MYTPFGDVRWKDLRGLREWLGAHDLKHRALAQAVGRLGVALPAFLLADTMDDAWIQTHFDQHSLLNTVLIQNPNTSLDDLLSDPLSNQGTFYDWHQSHTLIHQQLDQALGIVSN